ncbi:endonuclease VII domain-containing protein [Kitasatospora kifunensis]|uniref:Recombination endonuclease VII n=1 Tax=Kitasatospora kifunensis TaxID=58351 RepID=A0A7W7QZ92_KITKI|nr:endonuclease VII domain-containing protein [Kitasatospora kifunensis]MBB4922268.1 hypothetical protein [Kitasatospora kifunensis]
MKRCTKCEVEKPLEGFHKSARSPDGRQYWCKPCAIAAARERALRNPDAKREADRKYAASEKNKANRKARREGPQREVILEQKRQSWERHKEENARRAREARAAEPERFKEYYQRKYAANKEKILAQNRKWAVANRERVRAYRRQRSYGITPEEFDRKILDQNGRCEICGIEMHLMDERIKGGTTRTGICVDHCHKTGVVRGLICSGCNKGLGYFKDDPARLKAAAGYIAKYQQSS